ncbi:hypothetical protein ACF06W_23140 [Streptomyces albus]|uniref:hypothetical protein n=1 Tax=Streptomyces albus TaxID=1888 RepID=UPI0037020C54
MRQGLADGSVAEQGEQDADTVAGEVEEGAGGEPELLSFADGRDQVSHSPADSTIGRMAR